MTIKPKEATAIINSLTGGVVPKSGIQHITVGRKREISAMLQALEEVENGHSIVKFWIGEFGSGKSFMLHLLNTIAIRKKFVVSNADFTPERRLYSNDRKAVALYSAIVDGLSIATRPEGGALEILLDKWIEKTMTEVSTEYDISLSALQLPEHQPKVENKIFQTINELTDAGGFNFGTVMMKYYKGFAEHNIQLQKSAIRWLKGEYTTKTDAKRDLDVREIITDLNYYDMVKNFARFFVSIGYSGLMINLDEAINLYKIPNRSVRNKNYEKILTIYNDCYQGNTKHLFFNFAGTEDFLDNERRGLFSYDALKTRLEGNKFETLNIRDYSQPVIKLLPLDHNELFVLLKKLKTIFDLHFKTNIEFKEEDIHKYMENKLNQQGAAEFLTPREVIRQFINILNILRQNPEQSKAAILATLDPTDDDDSAIDFDSIEEI